MSNSKQSKLERWRAKYAALLVALGCLYSFIVNWGDNWFLTGVMGVGVCICSTIGFFDIKRSLKR
ncbi:hypothetical protein AAGS61_19585 [Lysinibacillus sp. KU-BSD001]|uniref:hypothetical protein n=1 Tax=Lysinibacillus sp. KU-BSD001 TaxID=3141328 RepID=UPI0036E2D6BA